MDDYKQYNLPEYINELNNPTNICEPTDRRRKMIFHMYEGSLGGKNKGGNGYELYTDFTTIYGEKIDSTGVIY